MKALLKAAWVAGAAPLVVGSAIFIAWLFLRADILMPAGVIVIYAGLCSIAVGVICLAIYLWKSWRSQVVPRRRLILQAASLTGLFLANFIAAGGFVYGAIMIESRYNLSITNHGDKPLQAVRINGGGVNVELGDIASGETVKHAFWIEHDGELLLTAKQGGEKIEAVVDGYVTNSMGSDIRVTVDASGKVIAEDKRSGLTLRSQPSSANTPTIASISSCVVAFLALFFSIISFRRSHRTSIRPVLIFSNEASGEMGSTTWFVANVGNGPALNVMLCGGKSLTELDVENAVIAPAFDKGFKTKVSFIAQRVALVAKYNDIHGAIYTSTCCGNTNRIYERDKYPYLLPTRAFYQIQRKTRSESQ